MAKCLVTKIFGNKHITITCCTYSTRALACGFLIVVKTGLISKSFRKGVKSSLNSDPLSNTTLCGRRYMHKHVLLNRWLTLVDNLSMYPSLPDVTPSRSNVGILKISNQPVAGSVIVIQVRQTLFQMIAPPGCCCLIDLLYGPIRST